MSTSATASEAADAALVTVNGEEHALPETEATLPDLLRHLGFDPEQPGMAVAIGSEVVPRNDWPGHTLSGGETVEVITAQQGG